MEKRVTSTRGSLYRWSNLIFIWKSHEMHGKATILTSEWTPATCLPFKNQTPPQPCPCLFCSPKWLILTINKGNVAAKGLRKGTRYIPTKYYFNHETGITLFWAKKYICLSSWRFHLEKNILQFWQQSPKTLTDRLSTWLGLATNQGWKIGLDCNVLTTFKNSVENQIQSRGSEWKCKGWQRHDDHVSRKRTWEGWLWFRRTLRWGFLVAGKMSNTRWRFLISYAEPKRHK